VDNLRRVRGLCGRVRTGVRVARGGRGERTLPLDHGSPCCRDGSVLGALDGRSSRLCVTEPQTVQPRSPRFHDRLRDRHLLHQLLAAFGEQPAQSVFGVVAHAVPSVQVAGSRVRSGQLRLGLVLWDIDAAGGTDLWRKHPQDCLSGILCLAGLVWLAVSPAQAIIVGILGWGAAGPIVFLLLAKMFGGVQSETRETLVP
jgi:hypothetical protein